jgi:glycosyltransferase involved in cell wall biosynthesis
MKNSSLSMSCPNGISIVICTYNGVSKLEPTLKSIFSLQIEDAIAWELIIIDNASTDTTAEFCERMIQEYGFVAKSRVILESKVGCNHARRRGMDEAKYEWLLFCDDDNHLFPDYIKNAWSILVSNPLIGALGGQGIALFEDTKPEWFDRYSQSFAIGPQSVKDGRINVTRAELYSAGTFFRKEVLMRYFNANFSCLLVGRKGNEIFGGEDVEFCLLLQLAGYEIWYSSDLKFYHYMPKARMTWSYYLKLKGGMSSTSAFFSAYIPFFQKQPVSTRLFYGTYFKNYIFSYSVWVQFLLRARFQPKRYNREQLELGSIILKRKAQSYHFNFKATFLHFKQLKKVLKTI